ncbi:MAG: VanZ family protein [Clostridiales bacterium]|nr:VanZ family protein [Clostridiales bacterium]
MKYIKIIPFITTFALMAVIFMFSSQNAETSSQVSAGVTEKIVDFIYRGLSQAQKTEKIEMLHYAVRKAAHFTLYTALGVSAAAMFGVIFSGRSRLGIWILAVCFCMLYAVSDELHQFFSDGRTPMIRDVLIDTAGAVTGGALWQGFLILSGKGGGRND